MGGRAAKTVTSQREILSDIPRWRLPYVCRMYLTSVITGRYCIT